MKTKIVFGLLLLAMFITNNTFAAETGNSPGNSPVTFLQNKGQWPNNILYQGIATTINVYFLKDGLSFAQSGEEEDSTGQEVYSYLVWNMYFLNANSDLIISGDSGRESKISYLISNNPNNWVIHPQEYKSLSYRNIYDAIDLNFYGSGNNLKYDYVIHPGGDINSISTYFEGVQHLSVNDNGELEITTAWNTQLQKAPVAWQVINGEEYPIEVQYVLINDTTFGFTANAFNNNYDLVIDPLFQFVWSSYTRATGTSDNRNYCFSNAVDANGNVYLTGMVDGTYPTTPGAYSGPGSVDPEIFVSKFSSNGTTLIYSTYISGSSDEIGLGIAVDALGQAYIVGRAMANWTGGNTYPTTSSAYQPAMYSFGGYDAILTVLNATGTGLIYSTFLGGNGDDNAYALALGTAGIVYITGSTSSSGNTFPTKATSAAAQQSGQGYNDAFVAKFNINLSGNSSLIYSIHLGGGGDDYGRSIAVNSVGNAFITGRFQAISSPAFPTTSGAYSTTYSGGWDNMMTFVTKLSAATPVTYNYSTYLASGMGNGIAVNPTTGEAYVVGSTSTFTFPTTAGVLQPVHGQDALGNHNSDAFVTKLNATGTALMYSTFLGGASRDEGTGIAVNSVGEVYVTGMASVGFPTSSGALQQNHATGGADVDFFAVQLNAAGTGYGCGGSTYIGGNDMDYGSSLYDYPSPKISLRDHGGVNDTITVSGTSHSTNFPTTAGSYSPNKLNASADQPVFFKLTCLAPVLLPVELISFTGSNEGNRIVLKWATASEVNNDYFTVEKSKEGIVFDALEKVKGAGNSTVLNSYSVTDQNPFTGMNYYRVKQTDFDGTQSYSQTIAVGYLNSTSGILVFPNPASTYFLLNFWLADREEVQINLLDVSGRKIKELFTEKLSSGQQNIQIDASGITKGVYFCQVKSQEGVQIVKIILQ